MRLGFTAPLGTALWNFILALFPSLGSVWLAMGYPYVLWTFGIVDLGISGTFALMRARRALMASAYLSAAIAILSSLIVALFGIAWTELVSIVLQVVIVMLSLHYRRKLRGRGPEIHPLDLPVFG